MHRSDAEAGGYPPFKKKRLIHNFSPGKWMHMWNMVGLVSCFTFTLNEMETLGTCLWIFQHM